MALELNDFSCRKCRGRSAFIFEPKKRRKADLKELSTELEKKGAVVNALTPMALVVKFKNTPVTLYPNCKAIVKAETEQGAGKILNELLG